MKYIKFFMRDKRLDLTLSMAQAERVIDSPNQLVKITDEQGNWTGVTLNKAEIKGTDHDFEKEYDYQRENTLRLERAELTPEEVEAANIAREKVNQFIIEKGIKKM